MVWRTVRRNGLVIVKGPMKQYIILAASDPHHVFNMVVAETTPPVPSGYTIVAFSGPTGIGWTWDGTTCTPVSTQPSIPPTLVKDCSAAIENLLDTFAATWGYTDLARAVTYVGDPHLQFNAEAIALRDWRSAVWVKAAAILAALDPIKLPTIPEVLAQLPPAPARPVIA